ncbi:MAG: class I tRNA ligase family protein, partial [Candidatus Pacebacteria bacterium]|nr:class I tRNA ligase family protein [Candidatus Paceibacterota bacterium]
VYFGQIKSGPKLFCKWNDQGHHSVFQPPGGGRRPPPPRPTSGGKHTGSATIKVFTTRPDTIFGATYLVLAPEHKLVAELKLQITNWNEVEKYIKEVKNKTDIERTAEDKTKTGVELKGVKAINPATKEEIPVWIADYVLATYGTGAIMAVPADDKRDLEFAEKFKLPIVENYKKAGFEDFGKKITKFKLRDWVFSRQRYWGEPIPVVHCGKCGIVPVPEKDLPIELPKVKNYQPTDSGESPLANIKAWVDTKCPKCKGPAKRETDTMPNWAGSSWYYLRYTDPKNKTAFASKKNLKYWTPVDWYNGGNEHTTLHLLYSRFWHKFLYDLKLVPTSEPYKKRTSHGMILGEGGVKMSKSLGNVINPDDIVKTYGADTLRVYEMFMGPFNQSVAWSTESIIGSRRFIEKVWRIGEKVLKPKNSSMKLKSNSADGRFQPEAGGKSKNYSLAKLLNKTIKKVSEDIEEMRFNTAISSMMILVTEMDKAEYISKEDYKKFLQILSPFAPHVTEELWNALDEKKSISLSGWPKSDESLMEDEEIKIVIQINGRVRAEMMVFLNEAEEKIKKQAIENENILKYLLGAEIKKIIYVKNRLINIVL